MTHLYLIRHGEAYSNAESRVEGLSCRGLTERGLAQAQALRERMATGEFPIDVIYASTLCRARQTAEAVSAGLNLPIRWDDELHELRPGDADGMTVEEARAQFAGFRDFLRDAYTPIATNGESWGSFQARVGMVLERIVRDHPGQRVAVVAHGGVIEASFLHVLGLGPQARTRTAFLIRNTAITHWRFAESHGGRQEWQLVVHNDFAHLRGRDLF